MIMKSGKKDNVMEPSLNKSENPEEHPTLEIDQDKLYKWWNADWFLEWERLTRNKYESYV